MDVTSFGGVCQQHAVPRTRHAPLRAARCSHSRGAARIHPRISCSLASLKSSQPTRSPIPSPLDRRGTSPRGTQHQQRCNAGANWAAVAFAASDALADAGAVFMAACMPLVFIACIAFAIMTLQRNGNIADRLCTITCQVLCSFAVPALLFTSMVRAAPHLQPVMLLVVPLAAVQVAAGWWLGKFAAHLANSGTLFDGPLLGWHPYNPAASANAIAISTARALGTPAAVSALTPKTPGTTEGLQAVVRAACAFGDPLLTLPALLALVAPAPHGTLLTAWVAAHLAAWSVLYWGLGPLLLQRQNTAEATGTSPDWPFTGPALSLPHLWRRISSRLQAELAPPQPFRTLPRGASSRSLVASQEDADRLTPTAIATEGQEGPPSWWQVASSRFSRLCKASLRLCAVVAGRALLNPPLAAVLAGLAVGSTRLARNALQVSPTHPPGLPWELHLVLLFLRSAVDALEAAGRAALPLSAVAMGAALMESSPEVEVVGLSRAGPASWRSSAWKVLTAPLDTPQLRAVLAVALVRFLAFPSLGLAALWASTRLLPHLLPQVAALAPASLGVPLAWLLLASCVTPPTDLLVAQVGQQAGGGVQLAGCVARVALVWRLLGALAAALWGAAYAGVGGFHFL